MGKITAAFTLLLISSTVFASHPHQAVCLVAGAYQDKSPVSFVLQLSSERTYENGDPNKDTHNYTFQVRVCDDDNDSGQCSTYASVKPTTSLSQTVTLTGMKNQSKTFFKGVISGNSLKGEIVKLEEKDDQYVRTMVPFAAKMTCISQTWVELKPEDDSNGF
jgi:hypothetical protein